MVSRFSFGGENTLRIHIRNVIPPTSDIPINGSRVMNMGFPYGWSIPSYDTPPLNIDNVWVENNAFCGNNIEGVVMSQ